MSPGLLQLSVLRHLGRPDEPVAVGSERRRLSDFWYSTLRHNAGATPVIHWLPLRQRVDFKLATLVHRSLSGIFTIVVIVPSRLFADVRE